MWASFVSFFRISVRNYILNTSSAVINPNVQYTNPWKSVYPKTKLPDNTIAMQSVILRYFCFSAKKKISPYTGYVLIHKLNCNRQLSASMLWVLNNVYLKGQCHEIFDFCFFSWISFPQAPEYTNRAISNFFENSRRYKQLKVHHRCRWHRWQMAKIFKLKTFNISFGHLWVVELMYI